jgi:hypothetical protein
MAAPTVFLSILVRAGMHCIRLMEQDTNITPNRLDPCVRRIGHTVLAMDRPWFFRQNRT